MRTTRRGCPVVASWRRSAALAAAGCLAAAGLGPAGALASAPAGARFVPVVALGAGFVPDPSTAPPVIRRARAAPAKLSLYSGACGRRFGLATGGTNESFGWADALAFASGWSIGIVQEQRPAGMASNVAIAGYDSAGKPVWHYGVQPGAVASLVWTGRDVAFIDSGAAAVATPRLVQLTPAGRVAARRPLAELRGAGLLGVSAAVALPGDRGHGLPEGWR